MGMDQQCTATAVTLWQQAQGTLIGRLNHAADAALRFSGLLPAPGDPLAHQVVDADPGRKQIQRRMQRQGDHSPSLKVKVTLWRSRPVSISGLLDCLRSMVDAAFGGACSSTIAA